MNGGLQVLRLELRSDCEAFSARVDELAGLALSASTGDANLLARAAVALHHAYGAFESALARIARVFDTEPSGSFGRIDGERIVDSVRPVWVPATPAQLVVCTEREVGGQRPLTLRGFPWSR